MQQNQATHNTLVNDLPPKNIKNPFNYIYLSLIIIALDQATKIAVRYKMNLYDEISVIGDFFKLTYVENSGAAFSISLGSIFFNRLFFSTVTFFLIGVIIWMLKKSKNVWEKISFALIIGGGIGNLIDRLVFGSVTDFFDFYFFNIFGLERWPIFNIADSSVVVAMFILIIYTIFFEGRSQKKKQKHEEPIFPSAEI